MSLLDDLSLTAQVAYSTRLLRSAYTGYCMRVRRASDSATADIGFDEEGSLDVAAIEAHCGANDGFVAIWYDQSGNGRNQIQETSAYQPQIWDGDIEEPMVMSSGDRPALWFGGASNERYNMISGFTELAVPDAFSSLVVFERLAAGTYFLLGTQQGHSIYGSATPAWWTDNYVYWFPGARPLGNDDPTSGERLTGSSALADAGVFDFVCSRSTAGGEVWRNGTSVGTYSGDYSNPSWVTPITYLGWRFSPAQGFIAELITFELTLDSDDAEDLTANAGEWFGYVESGSVELTGTSTGTSTTTGGIGSEASTTGTTTGTATVSGSLSVGMGLTGTSTGTSTGEGGLSAGAAITGTSSGTATVEGSLTGDGSLPLTGTITSTSTVEGGLLLTALLTGETPGTSTVTGDLIPAGTALTGTSEGASTETGSLSVVALLTSTSTGTSTVTGALGSPTTTTYTVTITDGITTYAIAHVSTLTAEAHCLPVSLSAIATLAEPSTLYAVVSTDSGAGTASVESGARILAVRIS